MIHRSVIVIVLCLCIASVAHAQRPSWQRAGHCDIFEVAEPSSKKTTMHRETASRNYRSPLYDTRRAEMTTFGHSYRLVGNKDFTRFPSHTWVGFTFDDGPAYQTTPAVLDALDKYNIPATFFVVGRRLVGNKNPQAVAKHRELVKETIRRGHLIANHTQNHKNLLRVSPKTYAWEIERGADVIEDITGVRPYMLRFPYGVIAERLRQYLYQEGYAEVRWNIDSADFKISNRKRLRNRVLAQLISWNGGIVLFHDTKTWTAAEIGRIFDELEAMNCRRLKSGETLFIPVSLHYFARDLDGTLRPIPRHAAERTAKYRAELPGRCKARR